MNILVGGFILFGGIENIVEEWKRIGKRVRHEGNEKETNRI